MYSAVKYSRNTDDPPDLDHRVEERQNALDKVEENKPAQRLIAAIAYRIGVTQTELAAWHDTGRRTIHSWLM